MNVLLQEVREICDQLSSLISVPFQIAFPVAVLVVLTRPNIKEAFQSSGF